MQRILQLHKWRLFKEKSIIFIVVISCAFICCKYCCYDINKPSVLLFSDVKKKIEIKELQNVFFVLIDLDKLGYAKEATVFSWYLFSETRIFIFEDALNEPNVYLITDSFKVLWSHHPLPCDDKKIAFVSFNVPNSFKSLLLRPRRDFSVICFSILRYQNLFMT